MVPKALPELQLKCKLCDEVFDDYSRRVWHTNLVHFPDKEGYFYDIRKLFGIFEPLAPCLHLVMKSTYVTSLVFALPG